MATRPKFRRPTPPGKTDSPEDLFYTLSERAKTHAYLRGPQQDALREYPKKLAAKDVAFELPTGAGKTTVGLLVAEWERRRTKGRAAYLTLTNQLAAQVIEEAGALGIPVADLRGSRERRSKAEEGRFLDASALGVSTYSNLFNVNPIINGCEVLVLDDAHGGGDIAASMWTLKIEASEDSEIHAALIASLSPLMTETQRTSLLDARDGKRVVLVDLSLSSAAQEQFVDILQQLPDGHRQRYRWSMTRGHLHACHVFASKDAVTMRPYVTPTFDHGPFAGPPRRVFLSATLGDVEDLKRAYAVPKIEAIRVAHKQDGRRYVLIPGLTFGDDEIDEAMEAIWEDIEPRRAVAIAPSFPMVARLEAHLTATLGGGIRFLHAVDVEESLAPFTSSENTILALANRYDGLDLPDDDCRLLVLNESPRATNDLETNLATVWKLGPALRWREATRLAQGMGRCTRNATDFAVILLLGESLCNTATNPALLRLLPQTLQAEITWGRSQLKDLEPDPEEFAAIVVGLCNDARYRKEAEDSIADETPSAPPAGAAILVAAKEVAYAKAIWSGDFTRAHELARQVADELSGDDWIGYRAWWLYLASVAAEHAGNRSAESDALRRAKATGVNAGWLDHIIRARERSRTSRAEEKDDLRQVTAECVWTALDELGWMGKRFIEYCTQMLRNLDDVDDHRAFHRGLVALGRLLGAEANAPDQQGDPDVIWRLGERTWICFEAKSEKLRGGGGISKKDVQQAKGHVEWVRFFKVQGQSNVQIVPVVVAPEKKVLTVAEPFKGSLFFLSTTEVTVWAKRVRQALLELRAKYAGQEYGVARQDFGQDMARLHVDVSTTLSALKATPL